MANEKRMYEITRKGAQHRGERDGAWQVWRTGDQLDLTDEQFHSGRYSHLGLKPVYATPNKEGDPAIAPGGPSTFVARAPASGKPVTGSGVSGGEEDENTHFELGEGKSNLDPKSPKQATDLALEQGTQNDGKDEFNQEHGEQDDAGPKVTKRKISSLIKSLDGVSKAADVGAVRDKVVELDIFEEDTLPTKKKDLLEALQEYHDDESNFSSAE